MPFHFYCPQGHMLEGHESLVGQQSQCPICGSVFIMPYPPGMSPPSVPPPGWPPGYGAPPGYSAPPGYGQPPGGYGPAPQGYQQPPNPGFPNVGAPAGQFPFGAPASGPAPWPQSPAPAPAEPAFPNVAAGHGTAAEAIRNFGQNNPPAPAPRWAGEPPPQPTPAHALAETSPAASAQPSAPDQIGATAAGATATDAANEPAQPAQPEPPRIVRIPCPQGHELQTPMDMVNQDVLCPICGTQFHLRYEDSLEFQAEQVERRQRRAERMNALALRWAIGAAVVVVVGIVSMVVYLAVRSTSAAPRNDMRARFAAGLKIQIVEPIHQVV